MQKDVKFIYSAIDGLIAPPLRICSRLGMGAKPWSFAI